MDLHLHLLPGVDDGARDLRASLEHAERLVRAAGASELHAWQLAQANPRFLLRHGLPAVPAPLVPARPWRGAPDKRVQAARPAAGRLERRP